jgi:FkbM family methyltransferase
VAPPTVDPLDTGIGRWLAHELSAGDVMMDVGANIGVFTELAASLVGSRGRVYAFEPAPENAARLHERFAASPQVSVVEAAVGSHSGVAPFFLDRRDCTRHSLARDNVGKAGPTVTVPLVALDEYRRKVRRLDVIKIDVQGAESDVIRGAAQLLSRYKPRMVLELWPFGLRNLGADTAQLIGQLESLGYEVFRLSAKGQLKGERHMESIDRGRWTHINIAAIPRPHRLARWARSAGRPWRRSLMRVLRPAGRLRPRVL